MVIRLYLAPSLELRDVYYQAGSKATPIDGVSLRLEGGQTVALMGANGAGKTTLLALCSGLLRPQKGQALANGVDLSGLDARQTFSLVAMCFQDPADQFFLPTAQQEIEFGLRQLRLPEGEIVDRVRKSASRLGLSAILKEKPHDLPAAERRLLSIACSLAAAPDLLCLDEPTQDLDAAGVGMLASVIEERRATGRITLIATHDSDFACEHCQYLIVLVKGQIAYRGDWGGLKDRSDWLESSGIDAPTLWKLSGA